MSALLMQPSLETKRSDPLSAFYLLHLWEEQNRYVTGFGMKTADLNWLHILILWPLWGFIAIFAATIIFCFGCFAYAAMKGWPSGMTPAEILTYDEDK
jgi:hypothetical protein